MKAYYETNQFNSEDFIYTLCNDGTVAGMTVHPHWHELIEILHVEKGEALQYVEDQSFKIVEGDIVFIGMNQIHATYAEPHHTAKINVFQLNAEALIAGPNDAKKKLMEMLSGKLDVPRPIRSQHGHLITMLKKIMSLIQEASSEQEQLVSRCMLQSECHQLFAYLIAAYPVDENYKGNGMTKKSKLALEKAFQYIDEHYKSKLTVQEVASIAGYSVPQFNRLMKRYTGLSFVNYVNKCRVFMSIDKMLHGMTITEAAYDSGFFSISSFNRSFLTHRGICPRAYLKRFEANDT